MSADEFIKLFDAAIFSESDEESKVAMQRLKDKREELMANQKIMGCTPEAKN